ncbi:hypothetical protein CRM22_000192 [Opisthorchis felineus]|uniref:J domain-containing protein n=1 Tax=Opisthorchis felineus TaxID=147828 RepID=A0A4S2MG51_OPIFE|nr:hypothetical protein CRM22_000192 [Opisthorchis felineus]TGZ75778.1 hypothetical protein CRM22_000192 [Opisthorchis felineus]
MFWNAVQLLGRPLPCNRFFPRELLSSKSKSPGPNSTVESAFAALGLDVNSSPEQCRESYLRLAKKLHPDSPVCSSGASNGKDGCGSKASAAFQHLHEAYLIAYEAATSVRNQKLPNQDRQVDIDESVVRRRAPQHRRYLETDSANLGTAVVSGMTPSERQKQLQTQRFVRSVYASADYRFQRLSESMVCPDSQETTELTPVTRRPTKKKPISLIERMADELIEESMRRGDFDNLQGHGQPLPEHPSHHEIFVDHSTHKLTQILANQGYLPEWIQQGKELRTQWENSIDKLRKLHSQVDSPHTNILWKKAVLEFQEEAKRINRSIDRYNLMVPALHLQRCHVDASTIVQEILKSKEANVNDTPKESSDNAPNGSSVDDEDEGLGSNNDNIGEISNKNIWDPRYIGELMRDFYRELAKAFVSSLRGFKNHR